MAEQPALNRSYVISYAANDRNFAVVGIRLDPRVAGYRVPEDLSPHPDSKRYPNHVFTGSQPSNGDERVTHIYEILPSPYVPFTRYDDDLGPIQGRRRAVKNEGQQADLTSSTKISYEGREGSAIVSNEIEESWSIKVDEDGNSLFPIKDRDFYDASRGAVQERRQLFVPTGEEVGSLENVNGVITQTSYEPYNEFLSVKIVQTYKVDGPQLIGKATDNDGQLVTVTTQRKGAQNYIPPNPTATRTVEVNREDAESLVERIVDTPEIFTAQTFSVERPDPIPQKFRVAVPLQSEQEIVAGEAQIPSLSEGEISRTEEQRNKFLKRTTATSRDQTVLPQTLVQKATDGDRQEVTITETLQLGNTDEVPTATTTVESDALGDGNYVIRKTEIPEVFGAETYRKTKEDLTPSKFRAAQEDSTVEENVEGIANPEINLAEGEFVKSEQQVNKFVKRVSTTSRAITEAVNLLERVLTPQGQLGTRTLTLAKGIQLFTPSATLIEASVEALGDGRSIKTETTVPSVFPNKSIRKNKADLTPEKFRGKQEDIITEESVAGQISPDFTLGVGEFSKSEEQVTEFIKRISTNKRDISATTDLTETVITQQGQVATRTLRLSSETQSIQPNELLIDGSIESLGDGRTIKTETRVPDVFNAIVHSVERPDPTPQKFRTQVPSITTERTTTGNAIVPTLADNQLSKSEQQITKFLKRISQTSRQVPLITTLEGEVLTLELNGGIAQVTETYGIDQELTTEFGTISAEKEALGGNKFLTRKVTIEPEIRQGRIYDESLDFTYIFEKEIVEPNEVLDGGKSTIDPRDHVHSVKTKIDEETFNTRINEVDFNFPEIVNISLPDVLRSMVINAFYEPNTSVGSGGGTSAVANAVATVNTDATLDYEIEQGYSGPVSGTRYVFIVSKENKGNILSILKTKSGAEDFPKYNPEPVRIEIVEYSQRSEAQVSVSAPSNFSRQINTNTTTNVKVVEIPPTLHGGLGVSGSSSTSSPATATAIAANQKVGTISATASATGRVRAKSNISATSPSAIQYGKFIYSISCRPYKYGSVLVEAVVVDISA